MCLKFLQQVGRLWPKIERWGGTLAKPASAPTPLLESHAGGSALPCAKRVGPQQTGQREDDQPWRQRRRVASSCGDQAVRCCASRGLLLPSLCAWNQACGCPGFGSISYTWNSSSLPLQDLSLVLFPVEQRQLSLPNCDQHPSL